MLSQLFFRARPNRATWSPVVVRWLLAFVPALVLASVEACAKTEPSNVVDDASVTSAEGLRDAASSVADAGAVERTLVRLAAANFVTSVSDKPDWPENDAGAKRLGYLRNGAIVSAYDPPIVNDECKDGWYELASGGFVCGKAATVDMKNPRVKLAPKQPDRDAGMPYAYGVNVSDGTPLYRRVLNADDRRKYEAPPETPEEEKAAPSVATTASEQPAVEAAGEESAEPPPVVEEPRPRAKLSRRERERERALERERERNKDPFRELDGGRPPLKKLKGRGVLVRRLAQGFTLALDRDFKAAGTRWWRTTFGFAAPFDRIIPQKGVTKYVGNWFGGEGAIDLLVEEDGGVADAGLAEGNPVAGAVYFVTSRGVPKITIAEDKKGARKPTYGGEISKRSAVLLTGRKETIAGVTYYETDSGFSVTVAGLRAAHPQIPSDVGATEKWIDVDLTRQQLVAFEGTKPVFATMISSGRRNPVDKERDFPTPPGSFRIREKHVTTTMDGDVAAGPYSIEDVPWVIYFQGSYALHGAFWHDSFGYQRSHGCVNLSPDDARTLFAWSDPPLPDGWHGVFAKDESSGSRIIIHEDPPAKHGR